MRAVRGCLDYLHGATATRRAPAPWGVASLGRRLTAAHPNCCRPCRGFRKTAAKRTGAVLDSAVALRPLRPPPRTPLGPQRSISVCDDAPAPRSTKWGPARRQIDPPLGIGATPSRSEHLGAGRAATALRPHEIASCVNFRRNCTSLPKRHLLRTSDIFRSVFTRYAFTETHNACEKKRPCPPTKTKSTDCSSYLMTQS